MRHRSLTLGLVLTLAAGSLLFILTVSRGPHSGLGGLLEALRFAAPHWNLTPWLAVHTLTLWMFALVAATFPEETRTYRWVGAVAAVTFVSSFRAEDGLMVVVAGPVVLGGILGSRIVGQGGSAVSATRSVFGATFVGTLVGGDLAWLALGRLVPAGGQVAVVGGAGILDALFVVPFVTCAWVLLWAALRRRVVRPGAGPRPTPLMHASNVDTLVWVVAGVAAVVPILSAIPLTNWLRTAPGDPGTEGGKQGG